MLISKAWHAAGKLAIAGPWINHQSISRSWSTSENACLPNALRSGIGGIGGKQPACDSYRMSIPTVVNHARRPPCVTPISDELQVSSDYVLVPGIGGESAGVPTAGFLHKHRYRGGLVHWWDSGAEELDEQQTSSDSQRRILLLADDVLKCESLTDDDKQYYHWVMHSVWNLLSQHPPNITEHAAARRDLSEFSNSLFTREQTCGEQQRLQAEAKDLETSQLRRNDPKGDVDESDQALVQQSEANPNEAGAEGTKQVNKAIVGHSSENISDFSGCQMQFTRVNDLRRHQNFFHSDITLFWTVFESSDDTSERDTSDVAAADKMNRDVTMIEDEWYCDTHKLPRVRAPSTDATCVEDEWYGHEPNVDRSRRRNIYGNITKIGDEWENSEPEVPHSRDTNKKVTHSRDTKGKGRAIPTAEAEDNFKNGDQPGPEVARHEPTTVTEPEPEPEPELKQRIPPLAEDEVHQQGWNMANINSELADQIMQLRDRIKDVENDKQEFKQEPKMERALQQERTAIEELLHDTHGMNTDNTDRVNMASRGDSYGGGAESLKPEIRAEQGVVEWAQRVAQKELRREARKESEKLDREALKDREKLEIEEAHEPSLQMLKAFGEVRHPSAKYPSVSTAVTENSIEPEGRTVTSEAKIAQRDPASIPSGGKGDVTSDSEEIKEDAERISIPGSELDEVTLESDEEEHGEAVRKIREVLFENWV
ncbi:hypothetical protein IQ07DRAFT_594985 [Pyrenochaeta sp. DS3sAY3a]|nr:hypothetical protein IQ07DRAFT_594985 [Pyrenochaeta sp. DS3sAY3a]